MILVTGGAGYIGSHCVLALLENGYEVLVLDNLSIGRIETVNTLKKYGKVTFYKGDLLDYSCINDLFLHYKIDAVFHFAAFSQVPESVAEPQKYYINNVSGTLNLLKAMLENNVKKIIFSSSVATYGETKCELVDEYYTQNPINPYGQTKLIIEKVLSDYSKAYALKSICFRYANVMGIDSKGRINECINSEIHLIPKILKSISSNKTFEIYGEDYNTKDGTCVRDYINVEDLVQAHILALKYMENGGDTAYINLGTQKGTTVKEVLALCEKITGHKALVCVGARRNGDLSELVINNSKAKKLLGWTPVISLEQTIRQLKKYVN